MVKSKRISLDAVVEDIDSKKELIIMTILSPQIYLRTKDGKTSKKEMIFNLGAVRSVGEVDIIPYRIQQDNYFKLNVFVAKKGALEEFVTIYRTKVEEDQQEMGRVRKEEDSLPYVGF